MSDAKNLLAKGLGILGREMTRLDALSENSLTVEDRDKVCAYMTVLRQLVGKDIGEGGEAAEMTEAELLEAAREFTNGNSETKRRRGRPAKTGQSG